MQKNDKVRVPNLKAPYNHEIYFISGFKTSHELVFICKVESRKECHYEPYNRIERVLL